MIVQVKELSLHINDTCKYAWKELPLATTFMRESFCGSMQGTLRCPLSAFDLSDQGLISDGILSVRKDFLAEPLVADL